MNQKLTITEVNISLVKPKDGLIGFASLVINNDLYISSIAIHKKLDGSSYRLTYPQKGNHTILHPINKQTSKALEQAIFNKLKDVISKSGISQWQKHTTIS